MIYFVINKKSGSYSEDLEVKINSLAVKYYGLNFAICGTVLHKDNFFVPDFDFVPVKGDLIVAVGGDGTVNLCLHYIRINKLQKKVTLGIIPRGTGNNMQYALRLSSSLGKAFKILRNRKTVKLQYGTINQRFTFFNCSIGFSSYILRHRKTKSKSGYLFDILSNCGYIPGVSRVVYDNKEFSAAFFHGYFMNTTHYVSFIRFLNKNSDDFKLRFLYSSKLNIFRNLEVVLDALKNNPNIQLLQSNLQSISKKIQLFKESNLLKQLVAERFTLYPSPDCYVEIDGDVLPWQDKYCIEYSGKINVICGLEEDFIKKSTL